MATPLTSEERKQRQLDILWNTMADNELLPYSAISSANKQLNTDNKSIIKSINEMLIKLDTNNITVENFNSVFNDYVGNTELDITDWNNLKKIDTNVIRAIYKLYLDLQSNTEQLADMVRSVNGVLPDVNGNVNISTGDGGTLPSNVILFEDWVGGESVTIDTGTVEPPVDTTDPILTITSGGTFTGTKSVTMSTDETATIYYTLDGSTPTTSSAVYSSALSISATTTLKAFAVDSAGNQSAIQTVTYTLEEVDTTAPTVTATPAAGNYTSAQSVTLSADETAAIYYTLDGTTPTTLSPVYSAPISIDVTTTIQFMAVDSAGNQSTLVSATYTIDIPQDTTAPVLTITPAATFTDSQTVTMSTDETATIWYTLDDTDPITSATRIEYTAAITLTETDTVKAYAVDVAGNASVVQTVTYTKEVAVTLQEVVYPDENGYLVMPVNMISDKTNWAFVTGHENATHIGLGSIELDIEPLFVDGATSDLFSVDTWNWVDYVQNMSGVATEGYTINNYGSAVTRIMFWLEKATRGSTETEARDWLNSSGLTMRLKLEPTYKTWTIPSNVSNVTTRATSDDTKYEYFKCTLVDGLGTYAGSNSSHYNSLGYQAHPSYSWTHPAENIKVNSDGTLEMVLPKGTLSSIDVAGVSAFLSTANIKIYYV